MSINKPPVIIPWADEAVADMAEPSDANKHSGVTPASPCMPLHWANWLWNWTTSAGLYLMGRGIPDYDANDQAYSVGDYVQSGGAVYRCKQAHAAGTHTPSDSDYWEPFGVNGNWLADALKARLAATLPDVSDFVTAMAGKLGLHKGFTPAGGVEWTTLKVFGIQVTYAVVTFAKSGGYPVSLAVTWPVEFETCDGVACTPYATNNLYLSTATMSATGATLSPQTVVGASFPGDVKAFVVAFGTVKSS